MDGKIEESNNLRVLQTDNLRMRIASDGVPGTLAIGRRVLAYGNAVGSEQVILPEDTINFARVLCEKPDTPRLKTSMTVNRQIESGVNASRAFKELVNNVPDPLRSHFIQFGRGSATWYGFLLDNQNPDPLIEKGRVIVDSEPQSLRKRRRARAFDALETHYSDEHKGLQKKHAAAIGSAIIVAVGTSIAYYYHRSHQE